MIQLHHMPSSAAMVPLILLEEMGLPYELKPVDRATDAHRQPEYLKLNPNGLVPVLVDGDLVLYETAAIALHLADTHPEAALVPALGTVERAHFYKWLMWMTNTLQATSIVYWYPHRWMDEGNTAGVAELKSHAQAKIGTQLDQLDAHLAAQRGPWFMGEHYTLLDAYALTLCRWTRAFPRPARSLPHLGPYLQRMLERPAVRRVFAEVEQLPQPWV